MASVSQVLYEVQHEKFLRWPSQMKTNPAKRDMTKYCDFHRDHGHRTFDYIQLKKEIEFLIRRGHLRRYVAPEDRNQAPPPPPRQSTPASHQKPLGEINVISGGFVGGGESSSARKAHLCSFRPRETLEVQAVSKLPRLDTTITFSDPDLECCQHPHDDLLVIRAVVANKKVHRVLIDNGSSADINTTGAHSRRPSPCQATTTTKFLIVEAPSAYNMLLDRPSLNAIRAVPSAYHMVVKFPTKNGAGKA